MEILNTGSIVKSKVLDKKTKRKYLEGGIIVLDDNFNNSICRKLFEVMIPGMSIENPEKYPSKLIVKVS